MEAVHEVEKHLGEVRGQEDLLQETSCLVERLVGLCQEHQEVDHLEEEPQGGHHGEEGLPADLLGLHCLEEHQEGRQHEEVAIQEEVLWGEGREVDQGGRDLLQVAL